MMKKKNKMITLGIWKKKRRYQLKMKLNLMIVKVKKIRLNKKLSSIKVYQ
jgi:hypothetical protein